ncbi:MAG: phosphoribosyltransferase family protein [Psychroflexus halocasei]
MTDKIKILDHQEIMQKLKRMSYQILESNINEKHIIVAGVCENGYHIAQIICDFLKKISDLNVKLCQIEIDKKSPINSVSVDIDEDEYRDQSVIIVDDVLKSGSTLIYSVNHFLKTSLKQLKTVVLIDRAHKNFPIQADFKGLSLSTTMKSHVEVSQSEQGEFSAHLVS